MFLRLLTFGVTQIVEYLKVLNLNVFMTMVRVEYTLIDSISKYIMTECTLCYLRQTFTILKTNRLLWYIRIDDLFSNLHQKSIKNKNLESYHNLFVGKYIIVYYTLTGVVLHIK